MTGWFDSHCHVQEEFREGEDGGELDPVLDRARVAGVERLVCIGTGPTTSAQAVAVARASEGVDEVAALLERELAVGDGAVVAVGECGLDYYYEHSPRDAQRVAFAAQIALAQAHDLTLVIHARDAWA